MCDMSDDFREHCSHYFSQKINQNRHFEHQNLLNIDFWKKKSQNVLIIHKIIFSSFYQY